MRDILICGEIERETIIFAEGCQASSAGPADMKITKMKVKMKTLES